MRRHGRAARVMDAMVGDMMWAARVHREARFGAIIVAGQNGEVLRVDSIGPDGYGVDTTPAPFTVKPAILRRVGIRWTQKDLVEAPCSVHGHVASRDRLSSAATSPRAGQVSTRKPKGTRT